MRIIFHRYRSICEPGYIDAFRALGITVVEDMSAAQETGLSESEQIMHLGKLISENSPMFVFSINFFPRVSDLCERLHILYLCVSVDCPVADLFSISIRNNINRVFLFDYRQYLDIVNENPGHIYHIPLSTYNISSSEVAKDYKYDISFVGSLYNEKNPYSTIRPSLSPQIQGFCDGLLSVQEMLPGTDLIDTILESAGSSNNTVLEMIREFSDYIPSPMLESSGYTRDMAEFMISQACLGYELTVRDRLALLASLTEFFADRRKVHLFTLSNTSELKKLSPGIECHPGVDSLKEMPEVFRSSRININTTMRPIRSGLPQRIWDVLGVGGFLLTNYQSEIPDYLTVGKHLEAFETIEEAREKADFYLNHEDRRLEIAEAGRREVSEKHSVLNRVTTMIRLITE